MQDDGANIVESTRSSDLADLRGRAEADRAGTFDPRRYGTPYLVRGTAGRQHRRMDTSDVNTLEAVDFDDAVELLGTEKVGRLVYTRRALPAVTPLNYVLRDGAIWIWTASTSSIAQAVRGAVVAFEVDQLDKVARTGWSVVVVGVAQLVANQEDLEVARAFGPEPWAPGRMEHLLRIPLSVVTARRIDPWFPSANWGDEDADIRC